MLQGIALTRLNEKMDKYLIDRKAFEMKYDKSASPEKSVKDSVLNSDVSIRVKPKELIIEPFSTVAKKNDESFDYVQENTLTPMDKEMHEPEIYDFKRKRKNA